MSGVAEPSEELFHFDVRLNDGRAVVWLSGEFDLKSSRRLREGLAMAYEQGAHSLTVYAADVSFIDSSGLAVLLSAATRCRAGGGQFALFNPSPSMMRALAASGLWRTLTCEFDGQAARDPHAEAFFAASRAARV